MYARAIILALCFATIDVPPTGVRAATPDCPTSRARFVSEPKLTLPDDIRPTSREVGAEIEVGSDGRVRAMQIDESSGDPVIDLNLRQTLEAARYEPAQTGCVAYSGGFRIVFGLPPPAIPPSAPPSKSPATPPTSCTPYVTAFLSPLARDRTRTGTAVVAVPLDAAGTHTGEPALQQGTGSPKLDAEALRIARTAQYNFVRGGPCMPQAFTYNLELTFQ